MLTSETYGENQRFLLRNTTRHTLAKLRAVSVGLAERITVLQATAVKSNRNRLYGSQPTCYTILYGTSETYGGNASLADDTQNPTTLTLSVLGAVSVRLAQIIALLQAIGIKCQAARSFLT